MMQKITSAELNNNKLRAWVQNTMIELTALTVPFGFEEEVFGPMMTDMGATLIRVYDEVAAYMIRVGEGNKVMFTCHLDTADSGNPKPVSHMLSDDWLTTDGTTILGADNKAGMTVLLHMIKSKVPGDYYFFVGEELGRIGSELHARILKYDVYNQCVSFDRRGKEDIIFEQSGDTCASMEYADWLATALDIDGLIPSHGGSYTDSYAYRGIIPECINIAVGYEGAHSKLERQDLNYLTLLCERAAAIDWNTAPISRTPQDDSGFMDDDIYNLVDELGRMDKTQLLHWVTNNPEYAAEALTYLLN